MEQIIYNKRKTIKIFIGLLLGMSNAMLMQTMLTTSLPTISAEFGSDAFYSWVYTAYILASTVTIPLFGKICDRIGYKFNFTIGGVIFFIGTVGCGLSQSMLQLVLFRVIMGVGSGIVIPATYGVISLLFEKKQMTKVFSGLVVFQILNNGIGSVLGGVLSAYFSWRMCFFILIPIQLLGFGLVIMNLTTTKKMKNKETLDMKGAIIMLAALSGIMLGMEKELWFIALLGVMLLTTFILRDFKITNGLLPTEIKANKDVRNLMIEIFLCGALTNICLVYLPVFMERSLSISTASVSGFLVIFIVAMGLSGTVCTRVKGKPKSYILLGWLAIVMGGAAMFFSSAGIRYIGLVAALILLGIGSGILSSLIMAYIQQYITESNAGMNSVAHLGRNIGGTIGVTVLQLSMTKNMLLLSISIMVIGYIGFMMALFLAKNKIYNVVGEEAQNG